MRAASASKRSVATRSFSRRSSLTSTSSGSASLAAARPGGDGDGGVVLQSTDRALLRFRRGGGGFFGAATCPRSPRRRPRSTPRVGGGPSRRGAGGGASAPGASPPAFFPAAAVTTLPGAERRGDAREKPGAARARPVAREGASAKRALAPDIAKTLGRGEPRARSEGRSGAERGSARRSPRFYLSRAPLITLALALGRRRANRAPDEVPAGASEGPGGAARRGSTARGRRTVERLAIPRPSPRARARARQIGDERRTRAGKKLRGGRQEHPRVSGRAMIVVLGCPRLRCRGAHRRAGLDGCPHTSRPRLASFASDVA